MPRSPEDLPFGATPVYQGELLRTYVSKEVVGIAEHVVEVDSNAVDVHLRARLKSIREILHHMRFDPSVDYGKRRNLAKSAWEIRKQVQGRDR